MEGKKISFSFVKTKKAEKPVIEEKKDFIECVEEKAIKVIGGDEVKENTLLVIPMKPNTLVTAERLKEIAEKVESALEEPEIIEKPPSAHETPPENETLEQMATRELLQDAKKEIITETPILTVPLPAKPVNQGEKESTLDDYESVPVQDFGLAMLRGMGWTPNKEKSAYKQPQLRPKGLGLGADKVVKSDKKKKTNKDGKEEDLSIVKNAYVKITTGKYNGYYGKVISLDEDNGRVMVDIAMKKETVSLSEFMMQAVSKSEFDKESKVLNAGSYEEYKRKETIQKSSKNTEDGGTPEKSNKNRNYREDSKYLEKDSTSSKITENYTRDERSRYTEKDESNKNGQDMQENRRERDRDRSHRNTQRRDATEDRSSRKKNKQYSSNESLDSLSDTENKRYKKERKRHSSLDSLSSHSDRDRKKKHKRKEKKRRDSSGLESDHRSNRNKTPEGKRDIDKKRKGKKKKRDRDRSPNYRKHRK